MGKGELGGGGGGRICIFLLLFSYLNQSSRIWVCSTVSTYWWVFLLPQMFHTLKICSCGLPVSRPFQESPEANEVSEAGESGAFELEISLHKVLLQRIKIVGLQI